MRPVEARGPEAGLPVPWRRFLPRCFRQRLLEPPGVVDENRFQVPIPEGPHVRPPKRGQLFVPFLPVPKLQQVGVTRELGPGVEVHAGRPLPVKGGDEAKKLPPLAEGDPRRVEGVFLGAHGQPNGDRHTPRPRPVHHVLTAEKGRFSPRRHVGEVAGLARRPVPVGAPFRTRVRFVGSGRIGHAEAFRSRGRQILSEHVAPEVVVLGQQRGEGRHLPLPEEQVHGAVHVEFVPLLRVPREARGKFLPFRNPLGQAAFREHGAVFQHRDGELQRRLHARRGAQHLSEHPAVEGRLVSRPPAVPAPAGRGSFGIQEPSRIPLAGLQFDHAGGFHGSPPAGIPQGRARKQQPVEIHGRQALGRKVDPGQMAS